MFKAFLYSSGAGRRTEVDSAHWRRIDIILTLHDRWTTLFKCRASSFLSFINIYVYITYSRMFVCLMFIVVGTYRKWDVGLRSCRGHWAMSSK